MNYSDIYELLGNIVSNYITNYLIGKPIVQHESIVELEDVDESNDSIFLLTSPKEILKEIVEDRQEVGEEIIAIDGSSRSLVLMSGIISISAVAAYSSKLGSIEVYPPLYGMRSLKINAPFIAISPFYKYSSNSLDPYIYSSKFIMTTSLDGSLLIGNDPIKVEAQLRFILETEALNYLKDKKYIIIDGPLLPSFPNFKNSLRNKFFEIRSKSLSAGTLGIVKRLEKSKLLISVLSRYRDEVISKYKIDPLRYLSDESLLFNIIRFNEVPPYKKFLVGPILKLIDNTKIYINYLIIPIHPFLSKFFILRIESLINSDKLLSLISNLKFTADGVPNVIAIADKTSKIVTSGLLRFVKSLLENSGVNISFTSRIEAVDL